MKFNKIKLEIENLNTKITLLKFDIYIIKNENLKV